MQFATSKLIAIIGRQINQSIKKSPDGVRVILNQTNILDVQADILGPVNTPYEGGIFRCKLVIQNDFPSNPPKGYFLTKIFHPNVSQKGQICVNTLKKDWNPQAWSLYNIFEVIKCLLIVPFPESALNQQAGKVFMENYQQYFKYAKLLTQLHAIPKQLKTLENVKTKKEIQFSEPIIINNNQNVQNQQIGNLKAQLKLTNQNSSNKKQNDKKKWLKRI